MTKPEFKWWNDMLDSEDDSFVAFLQDDPSLTAEDLAFMSGITLEEYDDE